MKRNTINGVSCKESSDESTEESARLHTNYSDPPKKITTPDKDKSAYEDQIITPSPFHVL